MAASPAEKGIRKSLPDERQFPMRITLELFSAFLLCPTKCWLKSIGEHGTGNAYAEWAQTLNDSYRAAEIDRFRFTTPPGECTAALPTGGLKEGTWRMALDVTVQTENLESRLSALERVPSEGRGKPTQFIPIRFIPRNKLTANDKLLMAFEAEVLSEVLGREVAVGRIIHGDDHETHKVKVSAVAGQVGTAIEKITPLLSTGAVRRPLRRTTSVCSQG